MNDNFRKHQKKRGPDSIDGFFIPRSRKETGSLDPPNNIHRSRSYNSFSQPSAGIGDFKRMDGFITRRSSQSTIPDGTQLGRRPMAQQDSAGSLRENATDKPKKRRTLRKVMFKTAAVFMVLCIIGSGYIFGKGYLKARQVFKGGSSGAIFSDGIDPNRLRGEGDGRINILLLARGGAGHDGADLTDTIMIASIDPLQKDGGLLSIPRDLWVKTSQGSMKINAVFATTKERALARGQSATEADNAGFAALESKVSEITGIPINYHAIVDFTGFEQAINTVGGIDVNVAETLYDSVLASENRGNSVIARAGLQHMDGKKALLYAQSRYGSARGDFDRNERQRQVLVALKDKTLSIGTFSNPVKVSQLMDNFGRHIKTNFTLDDVTRIYNIGKQIDSGKIISVGLADKPQELVITSNISGQSVVVPKAGTFNYAAIQSFVRNTLKDGFIRKENPSILVLNGTSTSGAATARAEELKSYGYNIIKVSDALTQDYNGNVLVDMRKNEKKYTKRYLELRLKTTATGKLPEAINSENADFVIIVGRNGTTQN